ncbi:MAG: LLM class flavin-dependent oxidoreductase [Chloroflexota bacterium]|nr:LLM class flavin-dependent oxidoreductase [Chloroflexota bacterium]MDQ6905768.1 LLM class flavin-dependent oxidoreductase [Chloroflexota bacterium]
MTETTTPRVGFWLPIFGGWLRNVEDEGMPATWEYCLQVARRAEALGFAATLIAELNLNDIKGPAEPVLEAWSTAAALAATTERLEIMAAIRPGFRNPAVVAKMAANIDRISHGRFTLNVVSAWWAEEARQYGMQFVEHDERYARTDEFLAVLKGMWTQERTTVAGKHARVEEAYLAPKPVQQPWPRLYAGGESPAAKELISRECDAYLMHGDDLETVRGKIVEMRERAAAHGKTMTYGMAAYIICRDSEEEAQAELARITDVKKTAGYAGFKDFTTMSQLERELTLRDYSVSNRGLRPNLVGTPEQIVERMRAYADAGLDLFLIQCSPMLEEIERIGAQVLPLLREATTARALVGASAGMQGERAT